MTSGIHSPGKGDRRRPEGNSKKFDSNYERIFGKKCSEAAARGGVRCDPCKCFAVEKI